jgi:hypothetical protein
VKGHIRKGYALLALKEYNRAQTAFQKAMEIDENNQVFQFINCFSIQSFLLMFYLNIKGSD